MTRKRRVWKAMGNSGHCDPNPEAPVARFSPNYRNDFLGVYLHWLGVATNEACPFCGHAKMDSDDLPQCAGLAEYPADDIVSWYREARRQMVKKPSPGVG
ncbi:reverse transcriptase [Trichonephila clavipes]|nr:reverse transcriptase [Trichonephila clavipes]